jgi:tetrahydromethanopterin S-methyltransferase subunit F
VETITVELIGTSPLICRNWSETQKEAMLAKQTKRATKGKQAKDPQKDYEESLYHHPDGGYGFPAVAFKAAAVRAGTYADMKMTFLRGAFHVAGEMVKVEGEPSMRQDMVRLQGKVADIRYRAQFVEWSTKVTAQLNTSAISIEQLANLFVLAGFAVGVGEWRPERNGQYGRFDVGGIQARRAA